MDENLNSYRVVRWLRVAEQQEVEAETEDAAVDKAFEQTDQWTVVHDDTVDYEVEAL